MKETKHIGDCYVDAGLIWIGDPCYFWNKEDGEQSAIVRDIGTWQQFCDKLQETPHPHRYNFNGLGVVVTSGLGDGIYPVHATFENEVITSVTIQLMPEEEQEEI